MTNAQKIACAQKRLNEASNPQRFEIAADELYKRMAETFEKKIHNRITCDDLVRMFDRAVERATNV